MRVIRIILAAMLISLALATSIAYAGGGGEEGTGSGGGDFIVREGDPAPTVTTRQNVPLVFEQGKDLVWGEKLELRDGRVVYNCFADPAPADGAVTRGAIMQTDYSPSMHVVIDRNHVNPNNLPACKFRQDPDMGGLYRGLTLLVLFPFALILLLYATDTDSRRTSS